MKVDQGKIHDHEPLEVYWMGFSRHDPAETDLSKLKSDLNWIEKKAAYGVSTHKSTEGDGYDVQLVALPHMKPVLRLINGVPAVVATIGGRSCIMFRVYVMSTDNMIGLPKVHWVNIHGIDLETGDEIVEKIAP